MKEIDEDGNFSHLHIGELKELIKDLDDETEVFIRVCYNPVGNIVTAGSPVLSTYGFFGTSIPCVVIEPACMDSAKK